MSPFRQWLTLTHSAQPSDNGTGDAKRQVQSMTAKNVTERDSRLLRLSQAPMNGFLDPSDDVGRRRPHGPPPFSFGQGAAGYDVSFCC